MTEHKDSKQKVAGQGSSKRSPSGSHKEIGAELKKAQEKIAELNDRLLRALAEMDNYRKRTEREYSQIILNANSNLIKAILPVLDDFERSLKTMQNHKGDDEFTRGMDLIYQKILTVLQSFGLKSIESLGMEFDVDKHDALMQVEKEGVPPNRVVEEHGKGYVLNDQVIRHAKVVVSK